jgi:N-acetylglucosamine-6-phosphate deacetylase
VSLALRGRVVTGGEVWGSGTVLVEDGVVRRVSREPLPAERVVELPGRYLVPGFVDLQVNGASGVDLVTRPERLGELSGALPATGVTAYLPTIVSLPPERYPELFGRLPLRRGSPGATPLGLHLEGPFISPEKRGAHEAKAISEPDPAALTRMLEAAEVGLVTLAPELPGARCLIETATRLSAVVSLGHSAASFETATAAFETGATSVTHLFNAMSPLHHREPGLPGAALAHPKARCGVVVDGLHVHPEIVRLAYERLGPDRMYLVTDAMAAAGMGAGEYDLAGRRVSMQDGVPRLEDGTLAGSVLTMDGAVRNLVEFTGCSLPEAVRMAAQTPAEVVGAARKGRHAPGFDADVVVLSESLEVEAAWAAGELVYESPRAPEPRQPVRPRGPDLDEMATGELLELLNVEDAKVAPAVRLAIPQLERVVEAAREALSGGGRVVYVGAGSSGRAAVSDAAECAPTFGVEPGSFTGLMAGGTGALAAEGSRAEEDAPAGHRNISELGVGLGDLVVGVSASGKTPFTLSALAAAGELGAATACVVNEPDSEMARSVDYPVEILPGPEAIPGSTRLKAGTAQKLALNSISTATLAGLGYVYGNLTVGVRPGNRKLKERAREIVRHITGRSADEAASALQETGGDVKSAVLLLDGAASAAEPGAWWREPAAR